MSSQSLTTDFTSELLNKFSNLENLYINANDITILNCSNLSKLKIIEASSNKLNEVNFTGCLSLIELLLGSSSIGNTFTSFDISDCVLLTDLFMKGSSLITLIDISNNINLVNIDVKNCTQNTVLAIENCPDLVTCDADNNTLTSINPANSPLLEVLKVSRNDISTINLSNNINLTRVEVGNNSNLSNIDLSLNTAITYFRGDNCSFDNIVNSQLLIDLDAHGLENGYCRSEISGGGSLTAAGLTAKSNLQAKGWNIVGI